MAKTIKMSEFKQYQRKQIAELRPYIPGEELPQVSISEADKSNGSPKEGDMIARNPANHHDQWLVAKKYFEDNFGELRASGWVAVGERLPEKDVPVLVFQSNDRKELEHFVCAHDGSNWRDFELYKPNTRYEPLTYFDEITFWMPLPALSE